MKAQALIAKIFQREGLNFTLTNRLPRRLATRIAGWFSRIEQPLVRDISIAIWRLFCNLDLSEARKQSFVSLRDCFIRELKDGVRPINADPEILVSPCDAIVGAFGPVVGTNLLQIKGSWYQLEELLRDRQLAEFYRDGSFATLRLTAGMYHRFHAPHDCKVERVVHIWGDTWNVNPIALARVERLFCRNERVIIYTRIETTGQLVTLVTVAAILVAGIRLSFQGLVIDPRRSEPLAIPCQSTFRKGQEMGWFEHGSTIIVLAPKGVRLSETVELGSTVRVGEALMRQSRA